MQDYCVTSWGQHDKRRCHSMSINHKAQHPAATTDGRLRQEEPLL